MQKRIMRLIAGAMIGWMLMASGELSGAVAMPESAKWANVETVQENQPATIEDAIDLESAAATIADAVNPESAAAALDSASDSEKQAANTNAAQSDSAADAVTPSNADVITLLGDDSACDYAFTPATNGVFAGYLFSAGALQIHHSELYQDGRLIAYRTGGTKLFSVRLSAGTEYVLKIYGTGSGRIEIARDALSRCYDQPLEMDEGGEYKKAIARAGDVHWYTVRAASDGDKLISVLPGEEGVRLSAWLVSDSGEILAESDDLEMGACFLSAFFAAGTRYSIRVFAREGETGKYTLRIQSGADAPKADSIELSSAKVTIRGRARTSVTARAFPNGSSGLAAFASVDPQIAAIRKDGVIEGRKPGTTRVIAYAYGGAQTEIEVEVLAVPVESISISAAKESVEVGETLSLSVSIQPENATDRRITFMSSDESVLTVDDLGKVAAVGEGNAHIVAISADGNHTSMLNLSVQPAAKRYRALLIGEQNYASTVETVRVGSVRSVESMEALLKTARFAGAECETQVLMDQPRDRVVAGIRSMFKNAQPQDVSIVYITCHGFYRAGMTFFVMADGSVLSASDLEKELRAIPGEIILLADCCGSGGLLGAASDQEKMIDGVTSVFQGAIGKTSLGTSKYHVLASALLDQDSHRISFSGADEDDMATVFARAVCDALGWSMDRSAQSAMNADSDYDGEVTFDELYRYVSRRIKWYLSLAGEYAQNAVAGAEGDEFVVFARTDAE